MKLQILQTKQIAQIITVSDAVKPDELRRENGIILVQTSFKNRPFAVAGFHEDGQVGYTTMFLDTRDSDSSFGRYDLVEKCKKILFEQSFD